MEYMYFAHKKDVILGASTECSGLAVSVLPRFIGLSPTLGVSVFGDGGLLRMS